MLPVIVVSGEADENKHPSKPYDPCSMDRSPESVQKSPKQVAHSVLSSASRSHISTAATSPEKTLSPYMCPSLHQLTGEDQHKDHDLRLPQQQPQKSHAREVETDARKHDRNLGSDSDSSSANGKTERHHRLRDAIPDSEKDEVYWEKRRKNNEAARKSREKRRMNDMMLAGMINILEEDNSRLRRELGTLKYKCSRHDLRNYGNPIPKNSLLSEVSEKLSAQPVNKKNTSRTAGFVDRLCYGSPPPLLAMTDAISLYPPPGYQPGFPYILPDAANLNQMGYSQTNPVPFVTGMQPFHKQRLYQTAPFKDRGKHELIEEGNVLSREPRSSNNPEGTASCQTEASPALVYRGSASGNYAPTGNPVSTPSSSSTTQQPPYFNCNIIQASHIYHLQHAYDSHPRLQQSSRPDLQTNTRYEEPLQLTIRRDCSLASKCTNSSTDATNKEEPVNGAFVEEPAAVSRCPASSFQGQLPRKSPSRDIAHPGCLSATLIQPAPAGLSPQAYTNSCFINGIVNLSEVGVGVLQANPVSLVTELTSPYEFGKDGTDRSRRTINGAKYLDPKYLERRRRNNEAARKCRENRKSLTQIKEAKSSYLETENSKLRVELTSLQTEIKQLRELIKTKAGPDDETASCFIES